MSSYHLHTPVGTFWIRPSFWRPGVVQLGVNKTPLGTFSSALLAADQLSLRQTGWFEWDCRSELPAPRDLGEWMRGVPREISRTPYLSHAIVR